MASTLAIPLATLAVGSHDFGPSNIPDADNGIVLTIDRTVSKGNVQGFNGQPATTQAAITTFQSNDGGTTWQELAGTMLVGGTVVKQDTGLIITQDTLTTQFNPGTSRQAKANVTVTGASVAVAGTLTTT